MAQTIKLKRSATTGKVPSTSNLALGELAVNTYDGRIFFKKNDGSDSIEHIVTTDSVTTGSIELTGRVTASGFFISSNDGIINSGDDMHFKMNNTTVFQLAGDGTQDIYVGTGGWSGNLKIDTDAVVYSTSQSHLKIKDGIKLRIGNQNDLEIYSVNNGDTYFDLNEDDKDLIFRSDDGSGGLTEYLRLDGGTENIVFSKPISGSGAGISGTTLTLSGLSAQNSETDVLTINGSNVIGTRQLGSNAFNSTAFATGDNFDADGTFASLRAQGTTAGDVGLGSVTNESKSTMFTNAALTGTPTAPTADLTDDSTQIATTAFVKSQNYITSADGGNAQTLDSIDSSGFIRANANDDVSAHTEWQDSKEIRLGSDNDAQLYHNGTNMFLANGTGNLIIRNNTNDGNVVLQSDDGSGGVASYLYLDGTNGKVQIDKPTDISDTTQSDAKTTGAFVVDGGVGIAKTLNVGEDVVAYASSDERYKDNVTPIQNPNEKLKQIGGYTFDWNDKHEVFKGQHDVGVIAQEIEKVLPEIVETRESGYKAVKYEKIVALLIESNKELLKRIEDLESKIK
jgi:hypothetical protein